MTVYSVPNAVARQEMSRAGGLPGIGGVGLSGQEVSGGRNFGVVSGEAVMNRIFPGILIKECHQE